MSDEVSPEAHVSTSVPATIRHLATASELRTGCADDAYRPARLTSDGFVHCSGSEAQTLAVAADYFADATEPLFVLEIEPEKLRAEVRFEAPAPIPGGGREHLVGAETFPHVYGPIDRAAVRGVGRLERQGRRFRWPTRFVPLEAALASL